MSNDLMIPDAAEVPAHIKARAAQAKEANNTMVEGISAGFPPSLRLNGKGFKVVDGNGEETPIKPGDMFGFDGDLYLPIIALKAKKELVRQWYSKAFNPSEEGVAPDCFSNDNLRPDPAALAPQSDTCAACAMNAWGSAKDSNGVATAGKACAETKRLAVFVPKYNILSFKIPPGSLKNFRLYVDELTKRGICLDSVKTLIGFDEKSSHPIMTFHFGGYLGEDVLAKITELAASQEAEEAIGGISVSSTKALEAPTHAKTQAEKEAPAAQQPVDDLGLGIEESPAEEPAPKKEAAKQPESNLPSDEDLMAELGL